MNSLEKLIAALNLVEDFLDENTENAEMKALRERVKAYVGNDPKHWVIADEPVISNHVFSLLDVLQNMEG